MRENAAQTCLSILFPSKNRINRAWLGKLVKRTIDIVISMMALVILTPLMGVIAIVIRLDSPGPIIYRGSRIGIKGKKFLILKFRTMYERPESFLGPRVTAADDTRITPFGFQLRKYKLNELPQFWNVLKGEMSLVGPRPEDPTLVKTWPIEVQEEVLSVPPGITSPASVLFHMEESLLRSDNVLKSYIEDIMPSKLRLDQLYVRNHSIWLDLDILFWTVLVLLLRKDSYSPSEELLFWGPISRFIRRYLSWFTLDIIITLIIFSVVGLIWTIFDPLSIGVVNYGLFSFFFSLLFSIFGVFLGVNKIVWSEARPQDALKLVPALLIATSLVIVINQIKNYLPTSIILLGAVFALCGYISVRYRRRLLFYFIPSLHLSNTSSKATQERVLIVNRGATGNYASTLFEQQQIMGSIRVVGLVENDLQKQGMCVHGLNVIGMWEDIPRLVREHDVGVIISAVDDITPEECKQIQNLSSITQTRLVMITDIQLAINSLISSEVGSSEREQHIMHFILEDDAEISSYRGGAPRNN